MNFVTNCRCSIIQVSYELIVDGAVEVCLLFTHLFNNKDSIIKICKGFIFLRISEYLIGSDQYFCLICCLEAESNYFYPSILHIYMYSFIKLVVCLSETQIT